jgi:hypothetical protein
MMTRYITARPLHNSFFALSSPRKQGSIFLFFLDSRFRGNDKMRGLDLFCNGLIMDTSLQGAVVRLAMTLVGTILLALLPILPLYAQAAPPPVVVEDCQQMYDTNANLTHNLSPKIIEQCQLRGFDPPGGDSTDDEKNWRPAGGTPVRTGTAGSIFIGGQQNPSEPPGKAANAATAAKPNGSRPVTNALRNAFGNLFPPNSGGSNCRMENGQNNCTGTTTAPNGQPVFDSFAGDIPCPNGICITAPRPEDNLASEPLTAVGEDIAGTFGRIQRLAPGTQNTMRASINAGVPDADCGATITLSDIETSIRPNPQFLAIVPPRRDVDGDGDIETSEPAYIYVYQVNGGNYIYSHRIRLAHRLDDHNKTKLMTIPQYHTFAAADAQLVLRVGQPTFSDNDEPPDNGPIAVDPQAEDYVLVAVSRVLNRNDPDPPNRERFSAYPAGTNELRFFPKTSEVDEDSSLPLNAPKECKDSIHFMNLVTPVLLHQPKNLSTTPRQNIVAYGVSNNITELPLPMRSINLTNTTTNSFLMYQPDSLIRLGMSGDYSFERGVDIVIQYANEPGVLHLYGPVSIQVNGLVSTIRVGGGGFIKDNNGATVPGSVIAKCTMPTLSQCPIYSGVINAPYPRQVVVSGKVFLPANLLLPTRTSATIRLPLQPPSNTPVAKDLSN